MSHRCWPLTSFQKELWLSHLSLPTGHPGISCGGLFDLDGVPEPELVHAAVGILVRHFPLLSATLRKDEGIFPIFEPWAWPEPDFSFLDLSGEPDPGQAAHAWLRDFAERPFVPLGGPLCRFALLRLDATKSYFVNRFFHLAGDGIVCITHFNVMASIYNDLLAGRPVALGPTQDWHNDVLLDQEHLASARADADKAFWREQLAALDDESIFSPRLSCPDRIDTIARLEYETPLAMAETLRHCAAEHEAGVSDILMALHLLVLARLYGKDRLAVQIPLRFGGHRDQWTCHGHRVNVVPLRVEIGAASTFATLLADIRRQMRALLRRARTPFQMAFRDSGEHLELSRIWDTNFNFIAMPADGVLGGVRARLATPVTSRFDPVVLGVYVVRADDGKRWHLSIDYSENHFSKQDAWHYLARLEMVLDEVARQPSLCLGRVGILLPHEQSLLNGWTAGPSWHFREGTIPGLFEAAAAIYANAPAVMARDGDCRAYGMVAARADAIAGWLAGTGVLPGEVVAVLARRHSALAETILGIMKAGAVYLPIDPKYPQERIQHMLTDSTAGRILTLEEQDMQALAGRHPAEIVPTSLPQVRPCRGLNAEDAAYLIYTSGSTGAPKGVLVSHRGFVNMIQAQVRFLGITPADHVLQFASPSFDASLSEIFMALLAGACLHPVSRDLIDDPRGLRDFMVKRGVSVVTFPPSYLRLFNREPFPGLRVLITAGEPPLPEDARHYATDLEYVNAYGPTEASVCATMVRLVPDTLAQAGLIGRPIANTQAYILDRSGFPAAPGIPGELCLAGQGLAIGYLGRRELTDASFVQAVFNPAVRIYHTGDRAAWTTDGEIVLLGRLDEQVKIRGHRVELGEIGAALEMRPDISQAVVLAVPRSGTGTDLVAFLMGRDPAIVVRDAELREWLRQRLPDYMLPVRFLWLETLPVTPSGKVDRRRLELLARPPVSEGEDQVPDGSALDQEVRAIFAEVLGEPVTSLNTDFFSLGGDSIRVMELGQRLTKRFGEALSMQELLADSSVDGVVARLSMSRAAVVKE